MWVILGETESSGDDLWVTSDGNFWLEGNLHKERELCRHLVQGHEAAGGLTATWRAESTIARWRRCGSSAPKGTNVRAATLWEPQAKGDGLEVIADRQQCPLRVCSSVSYRQLVEGSEASTQCGTTLSSPLRTSGVLLALG